MRLRLRLLWRNLNCLSITQHRSYFIIFPSIFSTILLAMFWLITNFPYPSGIPCTISIQVFKNCTNLVFTAISLKYFIHWLICDFYKNLSQLSFFRFGNHTFISIAFIVNVEMNWLNCTYMICQGFYGHYGIWLELKFNMTYW